MPGMNVLHQWHVIIFVKNGNLFVLVFQVFHAAQLLEQIAHVTTKTRVTALLDTGVIQYLGERGDQRFLKRSMVLLQEP